MVVVINPNNVRPLMDACATQVVDHITIGDSNSVRTRGWPHGLQWALLEKYGPDSMYGTGLFSPNERDSHTGTGAYVGYSAANTDTDAHVYHLADVVKLPMPDALAAFWDSTLDPAWGTAGINHIQPVWFTDANRSITIDPVEGGPFKYNEALSDGQGGNGYFRYISGNKLYYKFNTTNLYNAEVVEGAETGATAETTSASSTVTPWPYQGYPNEPCASLRTCLNKVGWPTTANYRVPVSSVTGTVPTNWTGNTHTVIASNGQTGTLRFLFTSLDTAQKYVYLTGVSGDWTANLGGNIISLGGGTAAIDGPAEAVTGANMRYRMWCAVFGTGDFDDTSAVTRPRFSLMRHKVQTVDMVNHSTGLDMRASTYALTGTQLRPDPFTFTITPANTNGSSYGTFLYCQELKGGASPFNTEAYPKAIYWFDYINADKTVGWALHQFFDVSGAATTEAVEYCNAMTSGRIAHWLASVGYRANELAQDPKAIVWIVMGINDANDGLTKAQYKANILSLIATFRAAWVAAGWDLGNLGFVLMVGQPLSTDTAKNTVLNTYRAADQEIAMSDSMVMAVNLSGVTTPAELAVTATMPAYDDYDGIDPTLENHLEENNSDSDNSYSILADRVLDEVAIAPLYSDRNNVGGLAWGILPIP